MYDGDLSVNTASTKLPRRPSPIMSTQVINQPQRKHPRYPCAQKLSLRYESNGQNFIAYGRCNRIGQGGLTAQFPADLAIGQLITLELSLVHAGLPLRVSAEVRHRKGTIYGFQFRSLPDQAITSLRTLFQADKRMS